MVAGSVVGAVVAATVSAVAVSVLGLSLENQGWRKKSVFSFVSSVFCKQIFPRCTQLSPFRRLIDSERDCEFALHVPQQPCNEQRQQDIVATI